MFTIFINNNPIYLIDSLKYKDKKNFFEFDKADLERLIKLLEKGEINDLYLYDDNIQLLFEKFVANFKIIEAAGGIVENLHKEILFIYRNNTWDLPKGKVEKMENIEETALREVEEECGIKQLVLDKLVDKTYHIYKIKGKYIFKITHWFFMYSDFKGVLSPQIEEGITKVIWVDRKNLSDVLINTFANIKLLCLNLQ